MSRNCHLNIAEYPGQWKAKSIFGYRNLKEIGVSVHSLDKNKDKEKCHSEGHTHLILRLLPKPPSN
jgi:hypothetical protein